MMDWQRRCGVSLAALLVAVASGCPAPDYKDKLPQTSDSAPAEEGAEPAVKLEPFDPPALADLDAKAEWVDNPVIFIDERFREYKAQHPPLTTVEEALTLKNVNDEENEKIVTTLGQIPPNDAAINYDAEVKRHLPGDINSTNPILASSVSDIDVNGLTGIALFSFDWALNPYSPAEMVVSWQTSKDKLFDKVVMRDDLFWTDGTKVTAHDVAFSYQVIMNPDVPVPAVRSGTDQLRWVHAYDDKTLVYFHKEPQATNVWNLNFPVIPKHKYEESLKDDPRFANDYHQLLELKPVTAGPYKVVSRQKGQEILLERNEAYYMVNGKEVRPKPRYKTIRFRVIVDRNTSRLAMNDGQLDEMLLTPEQWVNQTSDASFTRLNTKARGTEWTFFYFGWNMRRPLFEDVRVRQALSYAVDYDQIMNTLSYGLYERSTGIYSDGNWAKSTKPRTLYHLDLKKADQLLTEAGWTDTDGDGIRDKMIGNRKMKFEFEIICNNEQTRVDICSSLRESLGRLGIVCNVKPTEFTVLQERTQKHDYDATFGGWGTGADPDTGTNLWKTGEQRNYGGYSNPRVDELFQLAKNELDHAKRAACYQEIDDLLWEDQPYTWLYTRSSFYGFSKKLRGYNFSPRGPYNYSPGFDAVWTVQP